MLTRKMIDNLLMLVNKINGQLPPYSYSLFLAIFTLTITFQFIQSTDTLNPSSALSSVYMDIIDEKPAFDNNHLVASNLSTEREKADYQTKVNTHSKTAKQDDTEQYELLADETLDDSSSTSALDHNYNQVASLSRQNQPRIYIPGGGSSASNAINSSSGVTNSTVTSVNSSNNSSESISSAVNASASEPSTLQSEQLDENLVASNDVNTRAQDLYEQRRQNVCNGVIARVGTNPLASDFNNVGEYYRLRNGYRCF